MRGIVVTGTYDDMYLPVRTSITFSVLDSFDRLKRQLVWEHIIQPTYFSPFMIIYRFEKPTCLSKRMLYPY